MQNPKFWYSDTLFSRLLARILSPVGWCIYGLSKFRFLGKAGYTGKTPIICIGNATVGGTGKTPTAVLMANLAVSVGLKPAFLTKGYGGRIIKPQRINPTDNPTDTGDEALILCNHAPCFVSKDRVLGANYIDSLNEFDVIITDDGLQNHPSLHKDCVILTVDANRFFGNNHLMPAGALREPIQSALNKATYIMLIGHKQIENVPNIITQSDKQIMYAYKKPLVHGVELMGENVIVFSGLGNNAQFIKTIEQTGANIIETHEFPDHFVYDKRLVDRLIKTAQQRAALLVTTEKDMVKIAPHYYPYLVPFLIKLDISDNDREDLCNFLMTLHKP